MTADTGSMSVDDVFDFDKCCGVCKHAIEDYTYDGESEFYAQYCGADEGDFCPRLNKVLGEKK